jgi:acetyl-CoA carboxylase alpha subunit
MNSQEIIDKLFDLKVDLKANLSEVIDEVYAKYHDTVNMSYTELKAWSETKCSRLASLDRSPVNRNLNLLSKKKADWDADDAKNANRTISFVSRMKGAEQGEPASEGCPSKRDISLKNWAYNPNK